MGEFGKVRRGGLGGIGVKWRTRDEKDQEGKRLNLIKVLRTLGSFRTKAT